MLLIERSFHARNWIKAPPFDVIPTSNDHVTHVLSATNLFYSLISIEGAIQDEMMGDIVVRWRAASFGQFCCLGRDLHMMEVGDWVQFYILFSSPYCIDYMRRPCMKLGNCSLSVRNIQQKCT